MQALRSYKSIEAFRDWWEDRGWVDFAGEKGLEALRTFHEQRNAVLRMQLLGVDFTIARQGIEMEYAARREGREIITNFAAVKAIGEDCLNCDKSVVWRVPEWVEDDSCLYRGEYRLVLHGYCICPSWDKDCLPF